MRASVRIAFWLGATLAVQPSIGRADGTEKPVTLYAGLGAWQHPISTKSSEAQKFFDQGLTLVYSFNRYEALRSFRRASELDPSAAMPFWGMAMAQGPYINMDGDPSYDLKNACVAAETGAKIAQASAKEKLYLTVALSWCPILRPDAYVETARRLAFEYPDDADAQTLFADSLLTRARWHWYDANGTPSAGVADAEATLQNVIRRWPQHPGANHLFIHAVESSPSPERAIASAQRLMGIVPSAGHMVHMPAHIWLLLGDWETAAVVNERAAAVDEEYFERTQVNGGTYEPYYLHNLHFVLYARSMQGNQAQTLRAAGKLASVSEKMRGAMPEMADAFSALPIFAYVRFQDWDTILRIQKPPDNMPATGSAWTFARTLAYAARGDKNAAIGEQRAFEQIRNAIPANAPWGQNTAKDVMQLASEILAARLATDKSESCRHWQRAVDAQDRLVYDEPPAWYYPVRESLGAALLRAGRLAEARKTFEEGVRKSPRNGRMLFGLLETLRAEGNTSAAESVKREFETAWSRADVPVRIEDL